MPKRFPHPSETISVNTPRQRFAIRSLIEFALRLVRPVESFFAEARRTDGSAGRSWLYFRPNLEQLENRITPSGPTLSTLASFKGIDGDSPATGLIQDSSGNLYGTTTQGGANSVGTVFEVMKGSGTITDLAAFDGTYSSEPRGLVMDSSGNLYGPAAGPFAFFLGDVVFELPKGSSTIATLASIGNREGTDVSLIMGSDGNLYGASNNGNVFTTGTIFELSKGSGTISTLARFGNTDQVIDGSLIADNSGNLYGTAVGLSLTDDGTLFELAKGSTTITTLASFHGSNGTTPRGPLVIDNGGNLYGVTTGDLRSNDGTVFEVQKGSGTVTTLAVFDGANGNNPRGGLVMDRSGNLYGTTVLGGAYNDGTVFELAKGSSTITTLVSFDGANGSEPNGTLLIGSDGNLYGTTAAGGTSNKGTIFEVQLTPNFLVTNLADSGPGSLRDIINQVNSDPISNGTDQISFASNIQRGTISLLSPLPALTRNQVSIVGPIGLTGGNSVDGDGLELYGDQDSVGSVSISYFSKGAGVLLAGNNDTVRMSRFSSNLDGIDVSRASGSLIGGTAAEMGNVIINNAQYGINLDAAQKTTIQGNFIGTDSSNNIEGNNCDGVILQNGASNSIIGGPDKSAGNTVAYNKGDGVKVVSGTGNAIRQDLIYGNGGMPIELGTNGLVPNSPGASRTGPNNLQNYPIISWDWTSAPTSTNPAPVLQGLVQGYLNSVPNTTITIELYATWQTNSLPLGSQQVTTDSQGNAAIQPVDLTGRNIPYDAQVMATATDPKNNTSEFGVAFTPAQIRMAYGLNSLPAADDGNPLDGTGQTIAIVDLYNDPGIYADLDNFDSQFGLTAYGSAATVLTVCDQNGNPISDPSTNATVPVDATGTWEGEEALDVEWAHAIAPGAHLVLIECTAVLNGIATADGLANGTISLPHMHSVSVVSMSFGLPEGTDPKSQYTRATEAQFDQYFRTPGVTYLAASGDYGAPGQFPAYSPNVIAVGGTTLTVSADGSYNSEQGWSYFNGGPVASGGGQSLYEPEPAYQLGVQSSGYRTNPDVSLIGGTFVAVANSYKPNPSFRLPGNPGWTASTGTSLATPCWAGLIAIINQGRAAAHNHLLDSSSPTEAATSLYALPTRDFHNKLGGSNGTTLQTTRYDEITGLGTPIANFLVPDLINMTVLPTPILPGVSTGTVRLGSFPAGSGGPYSATVNWGDGTTDTSGAKNSPIRILSTQAGQRIVVHGSHAFPTGGLYTVAVTLTDSAGASVTHYAAAEVAFDVTSLVSASHSSFTYQSSTQFFYGSLTVTNTGSASINGSLGILPHGLPTGISLASATVSIDGTTFPLVIGQDSFGDPFIQIPQFLLGQLDAGQSLTISSGINDPRFAVIDFHTKVFSDPFGL